MGVTGKYDFPGIKSKGAKAIETVLSVAWAPFAAAMKLPVIGQMIDSAIRLAINFLTNKGLIVLNIGAIIVEGSVDQGLFDQAMSDALEQVKLPGLSPERKQEIDAQVIQAFRNVALVTRNN